MFGVLKTPNIKRAVFEYKVGGLRQLGATKCRAHYCQLHTSGARAIPEEVVFCGALQAAIARVGMVIRLANPGPKEVWKDTIRYATNCELSVLPLFFFNAGANHRAG